MKVLICGSRDWNNWKYVRERMFELPSSAEILTGGARGADLFAEGSAAALGLKCRVFYADWDTHGKKAGILRNLEMLDEEPDLVLAFQVGNSRGTQHTIDEAKRRGFKTEVHRQTITVETQNAP